MASFRLVRRGPTSLRILISKGGCDVAGCIWSATHFFKDEHMKRQKPRSSRATTRIYSEQCWLSAHSSRRASHSITCVTVEALETRRLLASPELDPTFGVGGEVVAKSPNLFLGSARDVAVQEDGKVVIPITPKDGGFAVRRFNSNGTPDTSFGVNSIVTISPNGAVGIAANTILVQSDGKIVAAGKTPGGFLVVRLNSNGTPDATFNAT